MVSDPNPWLSQSLAFLTGFLAASIVWGLICSYVAHRYYEIGRDEREHRS